MTQLSEIKHTTILRHINSSAVNELTVLTITRGFFSWQIYAYQCRPSIPANTKTQLHAKYILLTEEFCSQKQNVIRPVASVVSWCLEHDR